MLAIYLALQEHRFALKSLKRDYDKLKEKEKVLADILNALRGGYNPNYQDMAVLEAVRGWEEYAGISNTEEEGTDDEDGTVTEKLVEEEEVLEEGMWSSARLEYDLDKVINQDHINLLVEHDKHIGHQTGASLCSL